MAALTIGSRGDDGLYRGPDRRAHSGTSHRVVEASILASAALLGALAAAQVAVARLIPAPSDIVAPLQRVETAAGALAVVAGVEMLLRWRLDGRAFAWWVGLAIIVFGVPGLAGSATGDMTLTMAASLVASVILIAALRTPDVNAALTVRRTLLTLIASIVLLVVLSRAIAVLPHPAWLLPAALTAIFAVLATGFWRSVRDEHWLVLTLVGCALAQAQLIFVPRGSWQLAGVAFMHIVIGVIAVVGAAFGLQTSARTQRAVALEARQERDVVETRYAETMHEVRSTVVALEGGMRTLRPVSPSDESSQQSLAHALVAELNRLRGLVEPGPHSPNAEFSVRAALEPLLTVSRAGGWPVTWSIPADLRAAGRACDVAQIVHSILTNARRYAPGSPIEVSATREDGFVVLRVDDHGPGVARGRRELIFERGERSDRGEDPEAKGLGLHIARRLARDLDGELWVEPHPDGGARFVLIVPEATATGSHDHVDRARKVS